MLSQYRHIERSTKYHLMAPKDHYTSDSHQTHCDVRRRHGIPTRSVGKYIFLEMSTHEKLESLFSD
jgi:hypothetical protein